MESNARGARVGIGVAAGLVLVACGGGSGRGASSANGASALAVTPASDAYPTAYAVVDEGDLHDRERAASERSPGWTVLLEPTGLLSGAIYGSSRATSADATLTDEDRARVQAFFAHNADILGGDPSQMKTTSRSTRLLYQQVVDGGVVAFVDVEKTHAGLRIGGHFWPHVAGADKPAKAEPELRDALAKLEPTATDASTTIERHSKLTAKSAAGPIELHLAACTKRENTPTSCVDSRTGEPLHGGVGFTVSATTRAGETTTRHAVNVTP